MDFQLAKLEDLPELYANVHDSWPHAPDVRNHVRARLQSAQHQYAAWYIMRQQNRIASSLGAYPFSFRLHGRPIKAACIGAVHTHPDFRRQGLAANLMQQVEDQLSRTGVEALLLYSDIQPAYYEALGFCKIPLKHAKIDLTHEPATAKQQLNWDPSALEQLMPLYQAFQESFSLSVERSQTHWLWLLRRNPDAKLELLLDQHRKPCGYQIVAHFEGNPTLIDWCWLGKSEELLNRAFSRCLDLKEGEQVEAWLPGDHEIKSIEAKNPETCIPMLKLLDKSLTWPTSVLLQPIDHV